MPAAASGFSATQAPLTLEGGAAFPAARASSRTRRAMGAASSGRRLVYKLLIHLLLLAALIIDAALGQGAQMVGGRPPTTVTHELCDIASVFSQLSAIKTNPDCTAGCAQGSGQCPADWYPGAACVLPPPAFPRSAGA